MFFQHGCGFKIGTFRFAISFGVLACSGVYWSDFRRELRIDNRDGRFARAVGKIYEG
jgi:hypothetical protein